MLKMGGKKIFLVLATSTVYNAGCCVFLCNQDGNVTYIAVPDFFSLGSTLPVGTESCLGDAHCLGKIFIYC